MTTTEETSVETAEDYTPLEKLLNARPSTMDDSALATYVSDMRALRASAPTKKALVQGKAPVASRIQETISKWL